MIYIYMYVAFLTQIFFGSYFCASLVPQANSQHDLLISVSEFFLKVSKMSICAREVHVQNPPSRIPISFIIPSKEEICHRNSNILLFY